MLICCLYNPAHIIEAYLSCAEHHNQEIAIEADEKCDSNELDFSVPANDRLDSAELWRHVEPGVLAQPDRIKRESHLVRGPPCGLLV
jgi:hypothetical protein